MKVIALTRANNVAIMLTQFSDFSGSAVDIRAAVLSFAPLSSDRLSLLCQVHPAHVAHNNQCPARTRILEPYSLCVPQLDCPARGFSAVFSSLPRWKQRMGFGFSFSPRCPLQMAPTEEEGKCLTAWLGKPGQQLAHLSAPERFLAVMAGAPRIRAKCAVALFRAQLPGLVADVMAALNCLLAACQQVRSVLLSSLTDIIVIPGRLRPHAVPDSASIQCPCF